MYDFLLAHQINGQFVSADDLDDEDSILEVLDREEYNRISTGFFYLHQLLNPYMRCTFGTPEQRILYIEKSKNQRFSALQRVFIGIWSGENKLVSRSSVVDDILAILEDKRDDWNPNEPSNQIPHNRGSRLTRYLKALETRDRQHQMFPTNEDEATLNYVEFAYERYLYEFYMYFGLFRPPLPHHFNMLRHPPQPDDGDDWPEPIIPAAPAPPLPLEGAGGD